MLARSAAAACSASTARWRAASAATLASTSSWSSVLAALATLSSSLERSSRSPTLSASTTRVSMVEAPLLT
jgi:hypothetical protein